MNPTANWAVLPQGFRESPHLFGQTLATDLSSLNLAPSSILQYVEDLLLYSPSLELSQQHTIILLNFLALLSKAKKMVLSI